MFRINKMVDYATLILHCLSTMPDTQTFFSAKEIAMFTHIAKPTVSKLLKILSGEQLVSAKRGVIGGYRLIRSPGKITIAQILTAIEGPPALTECASIKNQCAQHETCPVKHNWKMINHFILTILDKVTLADMLKPIAISQLLLSLSHLDSPSPLISQSQNNAKK